MAVVGGQVMNAVFFGAKCSSQSELRTDRVPGLIGPGE